MLGEQLIKSDLIALVEIIKNSYDADATRVWVDFRGFGPGFETTSGSTIVITDNGSGMTEATLRDAWMSPATPAKLDRKRNEPLTKRGRALQGEKGIGRFAVFKLGSVVRLSTRSVDSKVESTLDLDISSLDDDSAQGISGTQRQEPYLEDIMAILGSRSPSIFAADSPGFHGTQVAIGQVRSSWSQSKVEAAFADLERLQPLMWRGEESRDVINEFEVRFFRDGIDLNLRDGRTDHFHAIIDRAVLKVTNGRVDVSTRSICFDLNGRRIELSLDDPEVRALRPFRDRFLQGGTAAAPNFDCGPFDFEFYVFDFGNNAPAENQLDRTDKEFLRGHRIYLYRDGVRVYPYGDPEDDWLQIDVIRGTQSARSMFSNDQTVGFISISQSENPRLRDKTNREGLLEFGRATGDFVALIQTVLAYLRSKPYGQYAAANRRVREQKRPPSHVVDDEFKSLLSLGLGDRAERSVQKLQSSVNSEREVAQMQIARTQELAGVGLSVEAASHDLIAASAEALRVSRLVIAELKQLGLTSEYVFALTTSLVQRLEFVDSRFQDVQGLFVSTRQKKGVVDVLQQARKVRSMYAAMHKAKDIKLEIEDSASFRANTTEAAVLQALINLVDNATFWLLASSQDPRIIRVFPFGEDMIVVTDNGPGVSAVDEPFIFEPFYSGKGDAGKGLGLYIARDVAARNGFSVDLERVDDERILGGATFALRFTEAVS
jgi:signal transduction histidine kinase